MDSCVEPCQDYMNIADYYGYTCQSLYTPNPGYCYGPFNDHDFNAYSACCSCGGGYYDLQTRYINEEGYCNECPTNYRTSSDMYSCFNDARSCSSTQYLDSLGYCTSCSTYYRSSSDQLSCIQDTCESTDIFTSDGYCQTCPSGFRPDSSKTSCINDMASCQETCQDYLNIADYHGYTCASLYTPNPGYCYGPFNDHDFTAYSACCSCGGGYYDEQTRYVDEGGYCIECPTNFRSSSDLYSCFNDASSCSTTQYLDSTGHCTACPNYYRASSDQLSCIQDTCGSLDILTYDGYCETCPTQSRSDSSSINCIKDSCQPTCQDYLNIADYHGYTCASLYTPNPGYCYGPFNDHDFNAYSACCSCGGGYYDEALLHLDAEGYCTQCPTNFRSSSDYHSCINDATSCSATQYIDSVGYCSDCNNLHRSSDDQLSCINDLSECSDTQQLTFNGHCTDCPDNHRSDSSRNSCFNDKNSCTTTQILDSLGYCFDCPTNYRGDSDATTCINDKSECSETEILSNDGYCQQCANLFRSNNDKTTCINDQSICADIQILNSQGYCEDCQTNYRSNSDTTECINDKDSCSSTQILDSKGWCTDCPDLFRSDADKLTCINDIDSCNSTQILDSSGYCTDCPNFNRANDDYTTCINDFDQCSLTQILTSDGYCSDCVTQNRGNADKTECINDAAQCPVIVILDAIGECTETCEQTKRANDDKTACIDDREICPDDYIIDGIGLCRIQCRLNTIADETHSKCVDIVENDDDFYGDYTFDYVDNGGTYYDDYCECEMAYSYLEQYGTPSYYDEEEPAPLDYTYTTPSGEPVYFGFYGTYTPPYAHRNQFDWGNWEYNDTVDYSKEFTDTIAQNNFVDLTQVVYEKEFQPQRSQDSDYMWLTNPSCDGSNFVANYKDGRQEDLYAQFTDTLLPTPFYREWHQIFYDPRAPQECVNNDDVSDIYGGTCSSYYDVYPGHCGYYNNRDFSAHTECCACGGGNYISTSRLTYNIAGQEIQTSISEATSNEDLATIFEYPPSTAAEYEQPEFSIQKMRQQSSSSYTYVNEHYYLSCDQGKIAYFGYINWSDYSPDMNYAFSQITADGRDIYCGTSVFGDPLPGWTKYCFCETLDYYYDTPTPDPATRFVYIDELMLDQQKLTQTELGTQIQIFMYSQSLDMVQLINGFVEGQALSGTFTADFGERFGDYLLQVNENYPFYNPGFKYGVNALTSLISSSSSGSLELNYVKYNDENGQVDSIHMANGDVYHAQNFFSQPFDYKMVDCANSGSEPTQTYKDKITPLLFDNAEYDSSCWFTSCDGTNYFYNCFEGYETSFRAKAERNDNGDIEFFHFDTDQFFFFYNEGEMSPMRVIYDRNYDPTGLTLEYTTFIDNGSTDVKWGSVSNFTSYETPRETQCSTSSRDFTNKTYFDMQWATDLVPEQEIINYCVNDDSVADAYGQICSVLYDSNPEYCGQLDTPTFTASRLCCACGGGSEGGEQEETCTNDDSLTDAYGFTCSSLYDDSPEACGQLDSSTFLSKSLCCACGGGLVTLNSQSPDMTSATQLEPGCYDRDSNLFSSDTCKCHASCESCIALDDGSIVSTGPKDCISCSDPRYTLDPYWSDGTGSCEIKSDSTDTGYNYDNYNGGQISYYDSADYSGPPPYECSCPEFDEFNFFTWMGDFFTWLASLFSFLGT